jgi:hypothetical protein
VSVDQSEPSEGENHEAKSESTERERSLFLLEVELRELLYIDVDFASYAREREVSLPSREIKKGGEVAMHLQS